ncbi:IS5 family transposase [Dactylosporangium sp. NPDC050588]|uniref:IS5 family transposase n=1 Tax=Dactylosporangium sp. NPDC050588 TaxID=3157211 RepID=UPI0033CACD23
MARGDLSNEERAVLAPLLPAQPVRGGRWRDSRRVLNAICWVNRTGSPWRDLPDRYGPWKTPRQRFRRWAADGTWAMLKQRVVALAEADGDIDWDAPDRLDRRPGTPPRGRCPQGGLDRDESRAWQGIGRSRGGLTTRVHTLSDGRGGFWPHGTRQLEPLFEQVSVANPRRSGRSRKRPDSVTGDEAYASWANQSLLRSRDIATVIPEPERPDRRPEATRLRQR